MKLKDNIDYGKAFEHLKSELLFTDTMVKKDETNDLQYRFAYARLAGALEGVITNIELSQEDDISTLPVFTQTTEGKEIDDDIENELIN